MDGNGRWAKARGLPRVAGHRRGADAVRRVDPRRRRARHSGADAVRLLDRELDAAGRRGQRPDGPAAPLSAQRARGARPQRRAAARDRRSRPAAPRTSSSDIADAEQRTRANTRIDVNICINYGARDEIVQATAQPRAQGRGRRASPPSRSTRTLFERELLTAGMPDPDLLIRTSGEQRISNFLLWQCAYAELVFVDTLWPDFGKEHLEQRDRRVPPPRAALWRRRQLAPAAPPRASAGCCCGSCRPSSWGRCCWRRSGSAFPGSTCVAAIARRSWSANGIRLTPRPAGRPRRSPSLYSIGALLALLWLRHQPALRPRDDDLDPGLRLGDRHRRLLRRPLAGGAKLAPSHQPEQDLVGTGRRHVLRRPSSAPLCGLVFDAGATLVLAVIGVAIAVVAQAGDLLESAAKRDAGVKDSGQSHPGPWRRARPGRRADRRPGADRRDRGSLTGGDWPWA